MRTRTPIEWTDATWNPTTGCTPVSTGCDHCYAKTLAETRLAAGYLKRLPVLDTDENRLDPFAVRLWEERLEQPARLTGRRRIFVNSMSDLFHVDIPELFVRRVFEVMLRVDRHVYQVLTKRPARASRFFERNADLFPEERTSIRRRKRLRSWRKSERERVLRHDWIHLDEPLLHGPALPGKDRGVFE